MPVAKQGRYVYASKDELSHWLGREAGTQEAVRIASENEELAADLKRSVANARKQRRRRAA